ncbi:OLC1v1031281C1 [Oldenlandia corymbosa var. corymbosa]|uniref:OLC1v1031281C1 n=1 Tax=Oldenlandia corymbosa var. corymbosa TaxID=529605 RepID=A0AAV1CI71_OLDCO|nr:OLC1v1031281C1 [Oldenlandia corymbosa var. corymbosa]
MARTSGVDLPVNDIINSIIPAHSDGRLHGLKQELIQLKKKLEDQKRRAEALKKANEDSRKDHWWKKPIEELDIEQLMMYEKALEGLVKKIHMKMKSLFIDPNNVNERTSIDVVENVKPFGGN